MTFCPRPHVQGARTARIRTPSRAGAQPCSPQRHHRGLRHQLEPRSRGDAEHTLPCCRHGYSQDRYSQDVLSVAWSRLQPQQQDADTAPAPCCACSRHGCSLPGCFALPDFPSPVLTILPRYSARDSGFKLSFVLVLGRVEHAAISPRV